MPRRSVVRVVLSALAALAGVSALAAAQEAFSSAPTTSGCQQSAASLCLNGGRFQVTANWKTPDGTTGAGNAVPLTDDSGYFWFFNDSNTEMVVKVLNGCGLNNSYWVFAAGLTNVQVNWQVLDTQTNVTYPQVNPQGIAFAPVQATTAFPTSCP